MINMRCLRICGAYSFRLSRRHSTLLLIASFIVTMYIIFQLYSYRHQGQAHTHPKIGDFDYRPGNFLRGRQPNENRSYCEFNYGLPKTLNWGTFTLHSSPEAGSKGPYKVIYNAIQGKTFSNYSKYEAVTYATQATPEFLYHVLEIARFWDGPISLSVFVPNYDLDITMQIMVHLCHCYPGMSKVSMHLFYPKKDPPKLIKKDQIAITTEIPTTTLNISSEEVMQRKLDRYRNLNNKTRAMYIRWARQKKIEIMTKRMAKMDTSHLKFEDCAGPASTISTFRREHHMIYPINVGRNVARNASATNYFLVSDIEMVPSDGLVPKFLAMIRKLMGDKKRDEGCVFAKTVFVVPLFEVERGEDIPRDKETLVQMVASNRATYFHQKFCSHCQRFPGLQSWLMRVAPSIVEPLLIAKREYPYHRWEPLYFGTHKEPWYSEMLSWEGRQDKMTQALEMCLLDYKFVVLDGGFLAHAKYKPNLDWTYDDFDVYKKALKINKYSYSSVVWTFWIKFGIDRTKNDTKLNCKPFYNFIVKYATTSSAETTTMLELCLQEYRMVVLDGAFLCHAASPKSATRHSRAERINTQRYMKIIGAMKKRYPDRPQCKINWKC